MTPEEQFKQDWEAHRYDITDEFLKDRIIYSLSLSQRNILTYRTVYGPRYLYDYMLVNETKDGKPLPKSSDGITIAGFGCAKITKNQIGQAYFFDERSAWKHILDKKKALLTRVKEDVDFYKAKLKTLTPKTSVRK